MSWWFKLRATLRAFLSLYGLGIVIMAALGVVVYSVGLFGPSGLLVNSTATPADDIGTTTTATPDPEWNESAIREAVVIALNRERAGHGVRNLSQRRALRAMADAHSDVMARVGKAFHIEPGNVSAVDRYEQRGLLAECTLPIKGTDEVFKAPEVVDRVGLERDVWAPNGTTEIHTEGQLGRYLVDRWLYSPDLRRLLLVSAADQVGVGVNVTADIAYVTVNFC